LTNVRIAILKDDYEEGELSKGDQDVILAVIAGVIRLTPKQRLP
jgi:hypothetical protein